MCSETEYPRSIQKFNVTVIMAPYAIPSSLTMASDTTPATASHPFRQLWMERSEEPFRHRHDARGNERLCRAGWSGNNCLSASICANES